MALRSLLRKAPALGLGLRSPATVRALPPPAAASRLMSHARGPGAQTAHSEQLKQLDIAIEEVRRETALAKAFVDESTRTRKEDHLRLMKELRKMGALHAVDIIWPASIILVMINQSFK